MYSPETELDLAFLKSLLESENIQYFVHNDHFGSLKVGPRIDLLNGKTIFVDEPDAEKAEEIIGDYLSDRQRQTITPGRSSAYSVASKLRVIIETLLFWWFIPQGRRWKKEENTLNQ
ncbi:MAG: DUF2007 domain-containing protein [Thermodesulfobacteriota bacterium]